MWCENSVDILRNMLDVFETTYLPSGNQPFQHILKSAIKNASNNVAYKKLQLIAL